MRLLRPWNACLWKTPWNTQSFLDVDEYDVYDDDDDDDDDVHDDRDDDNDKSKGTNNKDHQWWRALLTSPWLPMTRGEAKPNKGVKKGSYGSTTRTERVFEKAWRTYRRKGRRTKPMMDLLGRILKWKTGERKIIESDQ